MPTRGDLIYARYRRLTARQRGAIDQWIRESPHRWLESWPGWTVFPEIAPLRSSARLGWSNQQNTPVSLAVRFDVIQRDNYTCQYCGARAPEVRIVVDHVVPRAMGGTNDMSNLVTACWECNCGKRDRAPIKQPPAAQIAPIPAPCDRCDGIKGPERCKGVEYNCPSDAADFECFNWSGYCCRCGASEAYSQLGI